MFRNIILSLITIVLFSPPYFALAQVVVSEVQLSPVTERFIELYNPGSSTVDLTGWYIQRKTEHGSSFGSLVSKPNFENESIGTGAYFVISREALSSSDLVVSGLTLTDSNTIQIKNADGEVVDLVGWGEASECGGACVPNPPEGQSIQEVSSGWVVATPTPGGENDPSNISGPTEENDPSNTSGSTEDSSNISGPTGEESKKEKVETKKEATKKVTTIKKIETKITGEGRSFAGFQISLRAHTTGEDGEPVNYGQYYWNFGDGDSRQMNVSDGGELKHTYFYEGEYDVSLEYYMDMYRDAPDATDKLTVKVVKADITISSVGDASDFFVELFNNTNYDQDISSWILLGNGKSFILPRNTNLESKNKIIISPKITGFTILDKNFLKLMTTQNETVFEYASSSVPATMAHSTKNDGNKSQSVTLGQPAIAKPAQESAQRGEIMSDNLSANVIQSDVSGEGGMDKQRIIVPLVFVFFLGICGGAVYFMRKQKVVRLPGDDFKI
jgi:hypothetical protein